LVHLFLDVFLETCFDGLRKCFIKMYVIIYNL